LGPILNAGRYSVLLLSRRSRSTHSVLFVVDLILPNAFSSRGGHHGVEVSVSTARQKNPVCGPDPSLYSLHSSELYDDDKSNQDSDERLHNEEWQRSHAAVS
jgi:hypothetical protein